mmetsp:Transcript_63007/g.204270  ORF Transcript_63007/g.204270 Transcript_63007/m.204270 type:complete len:456 (-) Transcript_63007:31-1398(-)
MIAYATDVEGDIEYWNRYVEFSAVLRRGQDGCVELDEGVHFVFGGDVVDQSRGDTQVLSELLSLKRRYPERVHFIIGNRDANKLRLRTELGAAHLAARPLRGHPGPYWAQCLRPACTLTEGELESNSASSRLQWILKYTMGAVSAFEHRRAELAAREAGGDAQIDDGTVVQSFLESMNEGGAMLEYLLQARLAVRVGSGLFVHGGLPRAGRANWRPGWVPAWEPGSSEREMLPLEEWIQELERLRSTAMSEYKASLSQEPGSDAWSISGGYLHPQPGCSLNQYCMRDLVDGTQQASVVYNGWLGDNYQPIDFDDAATTAWIKDAGIRFVISGHLPHGDAPLVLRGEGVDAITADITYAAMTDWDGKREQEEDRPDRGRHAVCEVLLGPGPEEARVRGVLSSGLAYEASLADEVVGRRTADGWRVKGWAGQKLVLSRNEKYTFYGRLADPTEVTFI